MPLHVLNDQLWFPPVESALEDGLLAMGGDLSIDRLLLAYRNGIFPWFDGDIPLWWSPDPRFVLFPNELYVSKSMQQVFRKKTFEFRTNSQFASVIQHCKQVPRAGQDGTWITDELEAAFNQLHQMGIAHSAEAWQDGALVGGLYGIKMGNCFFGESMFSQQPNASKFALMAFAEQLKADGTVLIDCQVYTAHLESLGARMITRKDFMQLLKEHC